MKIATVFITFPSLEAAMKTGRILVQEKLAACVNIMPNVTSIYEWQGKLEEANEVAVVLKTTSHRIPQLKARVISLHEYDCPCIVAWNSIDGNEAFFKWVHDQTAEPS